MIVRELSYWLLNGSDGGKLAGSGWRRTDRGAPRMPSGG